MSIYGTGIPFNDATINSAFIPEARVIASGTASGDTYLTVNAALAAGARHIAVEPGTHAGFTITSGMDGARIVGTRSPHLGSGIGAVFNSTIVSQNDYVTLENLISYQVTGYGFLFYSGSSFSRVTNCFARESSSAGFAFNYGGGASTYDLTFDRCVAYNCAGDGFAMIDSDASSAVDVDIISPWIYSCYYGIALAVAEAYAATEYRHVNVVGGSNRSNSNYGVRAGAHAAVNLSAMQIYGNAGGVYISIPTTPRGRSTIVGNRVRSNGAYGIQLSATSNDIVVSGNNVHGHTSADLQNCASCPGVTAVAGSGSNAIS